VSNPPSVKIVGGLKASLASAAQKVYDSWDQGPEGHDEEYGGGGICHDIADAMVEVLDGAGVEAASVSQSIGEVHVFVVAKFAEGVYSVDIPPRTYERGSAYTWTKIAGVRFDPEDIAVELIDRNTESFESYIESTAMDFRRWLSENCGALMVRRTWPEVVGGDGEQPFRPFSRRGRRSSRRSR